MAGDLRTIVVTDAATFLLAAALIARARSPRRHADPAVSEPAVPPAPRGFLTALHGPQVRGVLLVGFCAEIAQGIFVVLFIVFVARRLGGGPDEIGLLRGVQAVGAIVAGAWLATGRRRRRPTGLVAWASGAFGLLSLTVWNAPLLSTGAALYVGLFVVVGAPGVVLETGLLSVLQSASRPAERGRVMSAAGLAGSSGQALGMLAAGLLTGPLGLVATLDLQGALYLVAGGLAVVVLVRPSARLRPGFTERSA